MGTVIDLRERPHHPAQYLLPWYVNGTLDEADTALVEAHLGECPECQADVEAELGLAARLTALSREAGPDMVAPPAENRPARSPVRFLRRPVALGWALGGQAVAAALLLAIFLPRQPAPDDRLYHVLGSDTTARAGNVIVLFAPEAREQAVRQALVAAGARVVDGPTASGAYLLQVPAERRAFALERLRTNPQVTLAEPIGGE